MGGILGGWEGDLGCASGGVRPALPIRLLAKEALSLGREMVLQHMSSLGASMTDSCLSVGVKIASSNSIANL